MEKSHTPISITIPEEILIEILHRLPFKIIHKFKWVSKSWHSLITQELILLRTPLMGLFYEDWPYLPPTIKFKYIEPPNDNNNIIINPTLSFLPRNCLHKEISDCCNGLLLCRSYNFSGLLSSDSDSDSDEYYRRYVYVCNPSTNSWDEVPSMIDFVCPGYYLLYFDPRVSPHYKVYCVSIFGREVFVNVYSSETRRVEQKMSKACRFEDYCSDDHRVLWNGALYLYGRRSLSRFDDCVSSEENQETIRFGLLDGDDPYELISFPMGTKKPHDGTCIGRLGDKLGFAGLDGQQLRVWILLGRHDNEWVLEHHSTICGLCGYDQKERLNIVGFHPSQNAILILFKGVVFAYNLDEMLLVEICQIESKAGVIKSTPFYPFSPCSIDLTCIGNDLEEIK